MLPDRHTETVETAVWGALLFSGEPQREILASLSPADFITPGLATLWHEAQAVGDGITPMQVAAWAGSLGLPYGMAQVVEWSNHVARYAIWRETADEVRRLRAIRDVQGIATDIATDSTDPAASPAEIADRHATRLVDIARGHRGGGIRTVGEIIPEVIAYLEGLRNRSGGHAIPTGYSELDAVSPLRPGELTILAARPSVGKSALAVNIATNLATAGTTAAVVSLEMTSVGLARRVLQSIAACSLSEVAKGGHVSQWRKLTDATGVMATMPLIISQPGRLTTGGMRRLARQLVSAHGAQALFVDYLQLVLPDQRIGNRNRENEVAEVSAAAKAIAVDCGVPMVMLAQLNRQAEGDKPRLSHLRDSGSIEQDADVVWLLDRDRNDGEGRTLLTVAKNRDGECGVQVPLTFDAKTTTFRGGGAAKYVPSAAREREPGRGF